MATYTFNQSHSKTESIYNSLLLFFYGWERRENQLSIDVLMVEITL